MQERERARLQKMGTSSLQTDGLLQSRRKRSFSLPSFRRSSAGGRQEVARTAEEAACVQKAAAWQWYTRGLEEAVAPTKRPPVGKSPASQAPISVSSKAIANSSNVLQKQPLEPPLAESSRAASRFKAEARFARPNSAGPSAPSAGPSTPLYDEFELSGLRNQMADFVQRLQSHQQSKDNEQLPRQPSKPLHIAVDGRPLPAAASTDHQHTKAAPTAAAAISSEHQLTKLTPSAAPFRMRPFSALHKLFRKVVSGSIIKSTKESPPIVNSSPAVYIEPEVLSEAEEVENSQYHYHHYIHHHHHHYYYGESPEGTIRTRRRLSESSDIRPHIPSPWEAESIEEEEEVERRSPFEAYLARRRRHSDTFAARRTPKKAAFDEEEEMKEESAKAASPLLPRRYNSERFSPNKCPAMDSKDLAQPAGGVTDGKFLGIKNRRHSAESNREAVGGEKIGGGMYKLTGAGDGATAAKPLVRRRHSEGIQRPERVQYAMDKRTPSPAGRPYWESPSARYLEDLLERQIGASAMANAAPGRRSRPIYSQ